MRRANEAIIRGRHPVSTVDEVLQFCLIHSRLQYANEAWGNSNSLHKLQGVQKRAIRVTNNKKNSDIIHIFYLKETTF